jgi:hypothetical protein
MATCQVGKISVVCEGGCGLICTSTKCWSWCEPVPDPVVIPAVMVLRQDDGPEADTVPPGAAPVTMCVNGATRRSLGHVLRTMFGDDLLTSGDDSAGDQDATLEPFTGTLDELLAHHGFRMRD